VEHPERREAGGRVRLGWNDQGERERADSVDSDPTAEGSTKEIPPEDAPPEEAGRDEGGADAAAPDELRRRLEAKDRYIQELHDELAIARVAADEARARAEAGDLRVRNLEEERSRLRDRVRGFEEQERERRRRREGQDRRVARLERELERRESDIRHLEDLLEENEEMLADQSREARDAASRKDAAFEEALRRIEGLERDLEEREVEVAERKAAVDGLRAELELEYDTRRRMSEPENRLRAGIKLFNDSEHYEEVASISKSLGQPEVRVTLGEGDEPPAILTFTWRDITWRTYHANPGLAVEEPRVYLEAAGEDFSGERREPSNAHVDPVGRVILGL
jgi:predicted RNase H-like nuclease (RuvC/YqgF family)